MCNHDGTNKVLAQKNLWHTQVAEVSCRVAIFVACQLTITHVCHSGRSRLLCAISEKRSWWMLGARKNFSLLNSKDHRPKLFQVVFVALTKSNHRDQKMLMNYFWNNHTWTEVSQPHTIIIMLLRDLIHVFSLLNLCIQSRWRHVSSVDSPNSGTLLLFSCLWHLQPWYREDKCAPHCCPASWQV